MSVSTEQPISWRELFNRQHMPRLIMLAAALWMHAANSTLAATTMPSAVAEVGGLNLISWTFALYLTGTITAGASVSLLVAINGLKNTMIRAAFVFTLGSAVAALAPDMKVLLVGRLLQGLGGGGLMALVFLSLDRFFLNRDVPKIIGFLSTVWMLSSFSGPVIGGGFATEGYWRLAFWAFAVQGLLLVPAIYFLFGDDESGFKKSALRIPMMRLLFLSAAILMVSIAGAYFDRLVSPILILLGCLSLIFFVNRDRLATTSRMLPAEVADFSHVIGNGILATLLLCISIMSFLVYGPLILIEMYQLTPLQAGFIILLESVAWGSAAILFSGVSSDLEPRVIKLGSACVLLGLIAMSAVFTRGPLWAVVIVILVSNGGFGMMWGFIIKRIVGASSAVDKDRTASLLQITQQTGFALGAALSGLIANGLGILENPTTDELRFITFWLFAGFVPVAFIGNIMVWRFVNSQ